MHQTKTYDTINTVFEKAVITLQNNLQYLANEGKVSDKFISLQNEIIKALINYQENTEQIISELEMENLQLMNTKWKEFQILEDAKWSLEAICIIHGIMDFPMWMVKGKDYLIQEAKETYQDGAMYLPYKLKEKFNKLPTHERDVINKVLYKKYDEEIERIQRLIEQLKKKRANEPKI